MVQFAQRLIPRFAMSNNLGNHWIIERGNIVQRTHARVIPCSIGKDQVINMARCGKKPCRHVLGIKTCFKSMTVDAQVLLTCRKRSTRRHTQLPFNQINARDRLTHWMFNL